MYSWIEVVNNMLQDHFFWSCNIHLAHAKSIGKHNLRYVCSVLVKAVHLDSKRQYTLLYSKYYLVSSTTYQLIVEIRRVRTYQNI